MFSRNHIYKHLSGFSLIEVLLGMAMGLLAVLVIMQTLSFSESRTRAIISGDDAQNNGAIALYGIQHEIQQAGYGLGSPKLFGCNLLLRPNVTLSRIAPVSINHGSIPKGDPNTDSVLVIYGNTNGTAEEDVIISHPSSTVYAMSSPSFFSAGDYVIAVPNLRSSPCNLILDRVVGVADYPSPNMKVSIGSKSDMAQGTVLNLGKSPQVLAYAIRANTLTVCKMVDIQVGSSPPLDQGKNCMDSAQINDSSVWVPLANNIVSLRAQYGRDTSSGVMDGIVDVYDQAGISPGNTGSISTECEVARILAIRLALVARSEQKAAAGTTAHPPSWAGGAITPIDLTKKPNGTANADWQNYRYKTFQTLVSLKNVLHPRASPC